MYLYHRLVHLYLLFATVFLQSEANNGRWISRSTSSSTKQHDSFIRRAHREAIKRSHGFARDLRMSFNGIMRRDSTPADTKVANSKIYCVSNPGLGTNGTYTGTGSTSVYGPTATRSSTGKPSATSTGTASSAPSGTPTPVSTPWKLVQNYEGENFLNGWDFFLGADPTNGIVTYVDENTARGAGLLEFNDAGNLIMRVETTPTVQNTRQSIRITTQFQYTGALILMDSVHMPTGCGTWPAFWSNGPNWPAGGEIDIVEGVHDYTRNQATLHTSSGCNVPGTISSLISGSLIAGTNCAVSDTANQGCGVRSNEVNSFGSTFNSNGGGVYALQWDADGVRIFFFPRDNIPNDIQAGTPTPSTWGNALAFWPASTCDPWKFFYEHHSIFDTTLCGDWAAGVWNSAGVPGQEQSCAQRTGFSTCEEFVRQNGNSFQQAYWEVRYVKIFQTQ